VAGRSRRPESLGPPIALTRATFKENALLSGLNDAGVTDVLENGRLITLTTPQQIYEAGCEIHEVFFPVDSVLSVVTQMRDGGSIEVGTVGREGVSAIPLLLGATTSANESYCQVPGRAVVISSDHFRGLLSAGNDQFRTVLNRFLQAYVNMLGQLAACNGKHSIYERCARWLLLTHDRVNSDKIDLSHQYLAMMLGSAALRRYNRFGGSPASWFHSIHLRPHSYSQSIGFRAGLMRVLRRCSRAVWTATGWNELSTSGKLLR
jgi:hypothetical protein